jgi:hypothetical protein
MADDMEAILRNSLDAVDRGRRWAIAGVVALFVGTAIAAAALFGSVAAARRDEAGLLKVLFVATATQMLFAASCTVVVMFHVSRTTKAVLRALELRQH